MEGGLGADDRPARADRGDEPVHGCGHADAGQHLRSQRPGAGRAGRHRRRVHRPQPHRRREGRGNDADRPRPAVRPQHRQHPGAVRVVPRHRLPDPAGRGGAGGFPAHRGHAGGRRRDGLAYVLRALLPAGRAVVAGRRVRGTDHSGTGRRIPAARLRRGRVRRPDRARVRVRERTARPARRHAVCARHERAGAHAAGVARPRRAAGGDDHARPEPPARGAAGAGGFARRHRRPGARHRPRAGHRLVTVLQPQPVQRQQPEQRPRSDRAWPTQRQPVPRSCHRQRLSARLGVQDPDHGGGARDQDLHTGQRVHVHQLLRGAPRIRSARTGRSSRSCRRTAR